MSASMAKVEKQRLDLSKPRWDQSTFSGRLKYFFWVTDPRTCLVSDKELDQTKELLLQYEKGQEPDGTTESQLWRSRQLYLSAFHPDTGEKQNIFGRMSFQVPGGMAITGSMLQFYRTAPAVVFWQWVNQSFNALVNYTNRNAASPNTPTQLLVAYVSATGAALATALSLKGHLQKKAAPLLQRWVPFAAVAAANCVNIPLMRQNELRHGVAVYDAEGQHLGESRLAAAKGISQVVISRIVMAAPGMTLLPVLMEHLEKRAWMQRVRVLHAPIQVFLVGCFLVFMTPTACALFPQQCRLKASTLAALEKESFQQIMVKTKGNIPDYVYFNKGL